MLVSYDYFFGMKNNTRPYLACPRLSRNGLERFVTQAALCHE